MRLNDEAMRHLRSALNASVTKPEHIPDALRVILAALSEKGLRMVKKEHIQQWIGTKERDENKPGEDNTSSNATDSDDEATWTLDGNLEEEKLHAVRKVLDRTRNGGEMYYLVDWEPTWEPRDNLPLNMIARFTKERRALVERTYIEYEAKEDNNTTEG